MTKKIKLLVDEIKKLKSSIGQQEGELDNKEKELQNICTHKNTVKDESYIPGGYLDRAEFITREYCSICGKLIKEDTKLGGFG